jgi:acyl-CoA thioester hydrolase
VKVTVRYIRPALLDEILQVHARVVAIGRTSFQMEYEIVRDPSLERVASLEVVYVNFDRLTRSSRPVPDAIRRSIEAFERTALGSSTLPPEA